MNDTLTEELPRCKLGKICIELPMPPAFMVSLYGDDAAFVTKYISKDNKYYITGDCGYFDEEGDIFIMTRLDDMIKTAGHRLSTGRMEEVIMKVKGISEVAVVPVRDELKGELPFAFVVVNNEEEHRKKELVNEAKEIIVKEIGAISRLKNAVVCERLPKTKSGKIVRSLLRDVLNGKEGSVIAEHGVEDGEVVMKEIKEVLIKENIIK
jgi:propionyl-CoA synthetase